MILKALIFDFDGVIAESVDIKTQVFKELFRGYPAYLAAIEKYHIDNGGVSRYEKFKYIYKHILKQKLSKKKFDCLCKKFHQLVVHRVIAAPFVSGAKEFLNFCFGKYPMYVISATPQKEMEEIIKRRNLDKYFLEVYGAPKKKSDVIVDILKDYEYKPRQTLFIGDSRNDFDAARKTGVLFVARILDKRQNPFPKKTRAVLNLLHIKKFIENK